MLDTLTVTRLTAIRDQWSKVPPIGVMIAAYMGWKPKEVRPPEELLAMFPGGDLR